MIDAAHQLYANNAEPFAILDRAAALPLISLALGSHTSEDWDRVAERIAALNPDFATLLRFVRREPKLLRAYFAVEAYVAPLAAACSCSQRLILRHAEALARGESVAISEATSDERLRVRLYELSLLAGAEPPATLLSAAQTLDLKTPEALTALQFLLIRMRRSPLERPPTSAVGEWPDDRRRIFYWRSMAVAFHRRLVPPSDFAQALGLKLTQAEKIRAARLQMPGHLAAAKRTGARLLSKIIKRSGLETTQWLDVALSLPRLARLINVDFWTGLVGVTLGVAADEYLSRPATLRLMTRAFGVDGVLHLYKHYSVRTLFEQTLENGARSSKRILRDFAQRRPDLLPASLLDCLENFTADRDTFITLVNEYLLGRAPAPDGDALDMVAAAFETTPPVARRLFDCETGRRLLCALSQFKIKHDVNLLRVLDASAGAPPAGEADAFFYELRNAFNLELALHCERRGGRLIGKNARRRLFAKFLMLEFGVAALPWDKLESARGRLRSRLVARINLVLEAQGGPLRLENEELETLLATWRDVDPVVTLLARLSDPARSGGARSDVAALVLMGAKAAARRNFMAFKFEDSNARRQLCFLTEPQLAAWRMSRAMARVGAPERLAGAPRLAELSSRLEANLLRLGAGAPATLTPELRADIAELAREEIKANPVDEARRVLAQHGPREAIAQLSRASLGEIVGSLRAAEVGGPAQRNAARIARALLRIGYPDASESQTYNEALADLRALEREIPRDRLAGETISQGMVVTALDCSPRLMLAIGDIVNTGCCLNYQCGARINILPAYMVDANIQALVSWQLKQGHFDCVADYKAVLRALSGAEPVSVAFDGDRLVFRFTLESGRAIETAPLGFAHLRQIVRLGRARKNFFVRPGLLAEREYAQPHPLQDLMHANHAEILRKLASEMQAVEGRPITFPRSRNPDGVYCDARGGVQAGEYTVFP